jgi:hypothetical protein
MRVLLAAALGAVTISTAGVAQTPRTENIQTVETFAEPFSSLGNLRALDGGDLLVTDRIEKAVYKINFADGLYEMIGLNGQGPQEYDMPSGIFPLGDGTSAIVDMGNQRIAVMDDDGRISDTHPMFSTAGFKMPRAGDNLGNVYYQSSGAIRMSLNGVSNNEPAPTEAPVARWNLENGREDTVATVAIAPRALGGGGVTIRGGQISGMPTPAPLRPLDDFAVAPDGRIGIARHSPYHVEWVNPNGDTEVGENVDHTPIPFRQSDKEGWIESQSSGSGGGGGGGHASAAFVTTTTSGGGGGGTRTFTIPTPDIDEVDFPEFFPPFTRGAVSISQEGDMWVQRVESFGTDGTLFDVFNSSGQLVRKVRIPEGRSLLGFGPNTLYAYSMDEDDLQWLERYDI